jgi:hypothetical protein
VLDEGVPPDVSEKARVPATPGVAQPVGNGELKSNRSLGGAASFGHVQPAQSQPLPHDAMVSAHV